MTLDPHTTEQEADVSESTIPGDVVRDRALEHMARGWAVFLLSKDDHEGKIPVRNCERCDPRTGTYHDKESCDCLTCHGFYAATKDRARFEQMLTAVPNGYLAVRTGAASRLLVVDAEATAEPGEPTGLEVLDQWEAWTAGAAGALPHTLTARSQGGGLHLYYRVPDGAPHLPSKNRVLPSVDVKADGGLVGAVGSRSGKRTWVDESVPVATLPPEFIEWYLGQRGRSGAGHLTGGGDRPPGYDFDLFLREGCPGGHRDYFFNDLLFRLAKRGVSREEVTHAAYDAWERCAQPPDARTRCEWWHIEYKLDRVLNEVTPDEDTATDGQRAWLDTLQPRVDRVTGDATNIINEPPPLDVDLTETGNAHRYARLFEGRALYVPGVGWHRWDGNVYRYDELNEALRSTEHVLEELRREAAVAAGNEDRVTRLERWRSTSSSSGARQAMLKLAAVDPRLKTSVDSLNSNPYLLAVPNGTVELRDRRLRESDPGDYCTQVAGVMYDPEALCPQWERHIRRVTAYEDGTPDPTLAAFIQRWAGYTLTGLVSEQKFLFGFGSGANGKNVTIEVILGVLGDYGIRGSTKLLGDSREHETVVADLANTRMVFIDETPRGRVNEARLKELTGSARIRARKIAKDSFEFNARFKLWIAGNNKPRVDETKEGFWRRLDLVPFDVQIPPDERVRDLAALLLRDEGPGILNWCLDGLAAYSEGGLEPPTRVVDAGQSYRDEENTTGQFITDTFETGDPVRVWHPNKVIMHFYEEWCRDQGIKNPLKMVQLGHDLGQHGAFTQVKNPRRVRWLWPNESGKSRLERGWVGPRLASETPHTLKWEGNPAVDVTE